MSAGVTLGIAEGATDPLTSSLARAVAATAEELGLRVRSVGSSADEATVDTLLAVGLPQLYDDLLRPSRSARRIAWFGEPLPRPGRARGRSGRLARAMLRGLRRPAQRLSNLPLPGALDSLRADAYVEAERQANLAAARRRAGTVDLIVVTSRDRRSILEGHGIESRVVPFGYHAAHAGPIVREAGDRDIPVVTLGSGLSWSSRRSRGLRACAERLGPSRLQIAGPTWGTDRDGLLRRSRVLLDVHRIPGNFIGLRILMAAAAGAVLVTEPMDDPSPFEPGSHYVEAPLAMLPDAVEGLLADEPRRRAIVEATQAAMAGPLSMATSLRAVLA